MTVHFICRGNAFRSPIAEAYLNSLQHIDQVAMSSGTVAREHAQQNMAFVPRVAAMLNRHGIGRYLKNHWDELNQQRLGMGDVTVFMNQPVYDEAANKFTLPANSIIWDIADMGEGKRVPTSDNQLEQFIEEAYQEIVKDVDGLIAAHE